MRRPSLATLILLGLVVGAGAGVAANATLGPGHEGLDAFCRNVANPVGQVFLRLLFMVVIPLVFSSLVLGVAGLGSSGSLGRVGAKTLAYFLVTTALAATLGIGLVRTIEPGKSLSREKAEAIQREFAGDAQKKIEQGEKGTGFSVDTFVEMVPKNVVQAAADDRMILGVIVFALLMGLAATKIPAETAKPLLGVLKALYEICVVILGFAMKLAPFGVAGLIFVVTAKFGSDILASLGYYLVTAISGLAIQQFLVLGLIVTFVCRVHPLTFFRRSRGLMVTAFSTSSSSATLPTTMLTAEKEFGVPAPISGFVLPLGATLNMNGTALFEGVTVLFLAQVAGLGLSISAQITVVVLAVLTAVGAAGVPGGSLPLLALLLARVGIPPEMIAVVLGVDRIVDMCRTVPNVTGDLTAAIFVARTEGSLAVPRTSPADPLGLHRT